jgi:hypothetical protein
MLLRLLSLVCLISVSQLSLTQQSQSARPLAPATCPVTQVSAPLLLPRRPIPPKHPLAVFGLVRTGYGPCFEVTQHGLVEKKPSGGGETGCAISRTYHKAKLRSWWSPLSDWTIQRRLLRSREAFRRLQRGLEVIFGGRH